MKDFDSDSEFNGLAVLAAVEKEMSKASRNIGNCKFSPKLARPGNPLGKLFDYELDEFSLCTKQSLDPSNSSSNSTMGSVKD